MRLKNKPSFAFSARRYSSGARGSNRILLADSSLLLAHNTSSPLLTTSLLHNFTIRIIQRLITRDCFAYKRALRGLEMAQDNMPAKRTREAPDIKHIVDVLGASRVDLGLD